MANRRDVLKMGTLLPAASLVAAPFARALGAGQSLPLERFVFDVRFAESGTIAEHVERQGVALSPVADDLMTLWYDDLDLKWRNAPMALAGVTLEDAFFVLETFALDRGMHVVYRGVHGLVENGRIKHRLAGPTALVERVARTTSQWEGELAGALTACPLGAPQTERTELVTDGAPLSLRDMPLYSWIIAPRAAVSSRVEA